MILRGPIADRRRRSWLLGGVYTLALAPQTNGLLWDPAGISGVRRFGGQEVTHSGLWVTAEEVAAMELARANPQGWNGYAYVTNNPAAQADALGLWPFSPPVPGSQRCRNSCLLGALTCCGVALASGPGQPVVCAACVVGEAVCLEACNLGWI